MSTLKYLLNSLFRNLRLLKYQSKWSNFGLDFVVFDFIIKFHEIISHT